MSNMAWSEQELANAAKRVAESMLTSFPSPSECEHVFSDDFEHMAAGCGNINCDDSVCQHMADS